MLKRAEIVLRIACLGLGALLLGQLARLALHGDSLAGLRIPAVPTLAGATNNPSAQGSKSEVQSSKLPSAAQETRKAQTNSVSSQAAANIQTNAMTSQESKKHGTNLTVVEESAKTPTNSVVRPGVGTTQTNSVASVNTGKTALVSSARTAASVGAPSSAAMGRMGSGIRSGMGPDVPPAIRARVERIYQSEIFGPIIRPQPAALLGIAGKDAFLRAPDGQTGLLKEGEELGGVKLLRIGINRVLIEEDGQQKELTLFSGLGGETLLPKGKEKRQ